MANDVSCLKTFVCRLHFFSLSALMLNDKTGSSKLGKIGQKKNIGFVCMALFT